MPWPEKSSVTWQEQVRTISSVVSAVCLLVLTVATVSAGVYAVNMAHEIQQHPGNLGSIVQNSKDAIESANHFLKSNQLEPMIQDFHQLIGVMSKLAVSIEELRVKEVLNEAATWRNMSHHAVVHLAKSLLEI